MPDERVVPPTRHKGLGTAKGSRSVGNMTAAPSARVPVQSLGRHQSRVYCAACGAKKVDGKCPRGHPC